MGMLWDLAQIVLAVAIVLWLLRFHDRLRVVERQVKSLEGGDENQENGDE
ncbi:MAG: hypothetical protein VX254_02290 [Planctomycetota bacterium]|nr:hypothetical protein [Planctomycetota bacterium]MEE3198832.1 hypothetical protein [Planctomycetota bacterium]